MIGLGRGRGFVVAIPLALVTIPLALVALPLALVALAMVAIAVPARMAVALGLRRETPWGGWLLLLPPQKGGATGGRRGAKGQEGHAQREGGGEQELHLGGILYMHAVCFLSMCVGWCVGMGGEGGVG